jgi:hypothetical protein
MKRILPCIMAILAVASVAQALPCPGVGFAHVCTYMQPAGMPGGNKVTMLISETAVVELVLDIPAGTTMLTYDAIINQYRKGNLDEYDTSFEIASLQGFDPPGTMNFIGTGDITPPAFAHNDDLQWLFDTTDLPLDANDGTRGPITLVMGAMTLHGLADNTLDPAALRFYSPGGLGGPGGDPPVDLKSPGGFQLRFQQGQWRFADVAVWQSVGGDPRFSNFFGVPYIQMSVNVQIPEPASLGLLAVGGLAALRRGCAAGHRC